MRLRSRPRSRLVVIGVGGGEWSGFTSSRRIASYRIAVQRITTYHPPYPATARTPHHTTLPRAPYPTPPRRWPLDPRRRADATDGQTGGSAQNRNLDSFVPTTSRHVVQRATPRHLTIPPFSSSLRRNLARGITAWAHRTTSPAYYTYRITSTNHSTNELYIQCIHCHIPSTHPSSAVHIVRTLRLCDVK
jgi:hypothetical protein